MFMQLAKQASQDLNNYLHESIVALDNLTEESKQSFFNFIKEQRDT